MFHYSLNFGKDTEADDVTLPFCFDAAIGLPAALMHREWADTFTAPAPGWFWPRELSVPSLEGPSIQQGGFFRLAYQMPDPGDLAAPPKQYNYDYSIVRWDPSETMVFQYQAEHGGHRRHPFRGGGTVTITPTSPDQCRLTWKGAYTHRGNRQSAEDVFAHYFSLFFTTMAKNIRMHAPPGTKRT